MKSRKFSKLTKLKSATKLALFSTFMMFGTMIILYVSLSFAFHDRLRDIQKSILTEGVRSIQFQLAKGVPYEELICANFYFVVYDANQTILFDGSKEKNNFRDSNAIHETITAGGNEIQIFSSITPQDKGSEYFSVAFFSPLLLISIFSFLISSLIIDRVLNPVRVMIEKVKSIGNKNFNSKIFIDSTEDELKEYAYAFNHMSSQISEYIEKQKQFISDASHELATPITVIVGHADMLIRWGKENPTTLDAGLLTIKNEAISMNELIENLLFFARTDNQKISYDRKPINLTSLLHECVMEQKMLHPAFEIIFEYDKPFLILADYEAMKRVIRIIVTNSIKFSPHEKQITITMEKTSHATNVCFSDKGIGMDPAYASKIFHRFFRIDDSRTKQTGGTGLGLSIAKEIMDAHHFSITAQSNINEGTTITIQMESPLSSSNLHDNTMTYS